MTPESDSLLASAPSLDTPDFIVPEIGDDAAPEHPTHVEATVEANAEDTLSEDSLSEDSLSLDSTGEMLKNLPSEVLAYLIRSLPPREAWKWLNQEEHLALTRGITRGFQHNQTALRQPIVRARLSKHFEIHPGQARPLLEIWAQTPPAPRVVGEVREQADDAALIEDLPRLWRRHGGEALVLALAFAGRESAIDAMEAVADAVSDWENESENISLVNANDSDSASKNSEIPSELTTETAPQSTLAATEESSPLIGRLSEQIDEQRARIEALQNALAQAQSTLKTYSERARLEAQALTRTLKAAERRGESSEGTLHETKKIFDRTSRRLRHIEKEHEETLVENKRVKRQMRRQQEISEELRKQIAHMAARLEALEPAAPKAAPIVEKPVVKAAAISPLDKKYIWKSDGRPFQVSARDVQKRVDANDEEWVFRLIQALDSLRQSNVVGHRLFLDALGALDAYYKRVLTADTTRVLIDASNVARYEKDRNGRGQLRHLLGMRDDLRRRNCFPIKIIADASLPYNIDDAAQLHAMARHGEIEFAAAGQEADELLAREARRTGAYVVTNDKGFFLKVTPDFEPPRITFRIIDGFLIVDDF